MVAIRKRLVQFSVQKLLSELQSEHDQSLIFACDFVYFLNLRKTMNWDKKKDFALVNLGIWNSELALCIYVVRVTS